MNLATRKKSTWWCIFLLFVILNQTTWASDLPMTCSPPAGELEVTIYVGGTLHFYEWTAHSINLKGTQNLKEHPMDEPYPYKTYGGGE